MQIAIRMGANGVPYTCSDFLERFGIQKLSYYNFILVEVPDSCTDFVPEDFNSDLSFSIEKYNERKTKDLKIKYKHKVEELIAQRYSFGDELALQRQKDKKPEEYQEYYDFAEECKVKARAMIYNTYTT